MASAYEFCGVSVVFCGVEFVAPVFHVVLCVGFCEC